MVLYVAANVGGSAGPATIDSVPHKALAAFDAVANEARGRPVVITANSFGTAAALHVAANRPAAALILQHPVPLLRIILGKYGWWNVWIGAGAMALQVPDELSARYTTPQIPVPACFLISERDAFVPMDYQRMIVDAYSGEKHSIILGGFGHCIHASDPDL